MSPTRGDVWWFEFGVSLVDDWAERPGVVVSSDYFNTRLDTLIVVPLTTRQRRAQQAGCVRVPRAAVHGGAGLTTDSVALCHSPLTVPRDCADRQLGKIASGVLSEIEETLAAALGLG